MAEELKSYNKGIEINWIDANYKTGKVLLSVDEVIILDSGEKIISKEDVRLELNAQQCFAMLATYAAPMIQESIGAKFGEISILGG